MNNHYILGKDILTIIVKEFSGKTVGSEECNMESIMNYFFPQNREKVEVEINKKKVIIEKESICSFPYPKCVTS